MAESHGQQNIMIRKIYLTPVTPSLRNKIKSHFEQYGEIEFIEFHKKLNCAFLQFKYASSAMAAIGEIKQCIDPNVKVITVKAAHEWHQPKNDLFTPPNKNSPSHILAKLNDNCLTEIFERVRLSDLCSIAKVCTKFEAIANDVFTRKHSNFNIEMVNAAYESDDEDEDDDDHDHYHDDDDDEHNVVDYGFPCQICMEKRILKERVLNERTLNIVERVFRVFGSHIKTLILDQYDCGAHQNDRVLNLLADYCSSETAAINEITLYNFTINGQLIQRLQPVFSHLKQLYVRGGDYGTNIAELFAANDKLEELTLDTAHIHQVLLQHFPKLIKLTLSIVADINNDALDQILKMNPQLKWLVIREYPRNRQFTTIIFRSIGMHLPELEQLYIHDQISTSESVTQHLEHFLNLKFLKTVSLNCSNLPVHVLLQALVNSGAPIESLDLSDFILDSVIADHMKKLTNIKHLAFFRGMCQVDFADVIKTMPHLSKIDWAVFGQLNLIEIKNIIKATPKLIEFGLDCQCDITIKVKDFKEIVTLITDRGNDETLTLEISGENCNLKIPNELIDQNKRWLNVVLFGKHHKKFNARMTSTRESDSDSIDSDDSSDDSDDSYSSRLVLYHRDFAPYFYRENDEDDDEEGDDENYEEDDEDFLSDVIVAAVLRNLLED